MEDANAGAVVRLAIERRFLRSRKPDSDASVRASSVHRTYRVRRNEVSELNTCLVGPIEVIAERHVPNPTCDASVPWI
jgi:hypothetical protein